MPTTAFFTHFSTVLAWKSGVRKFIVSSYHLSEGQAGRFWIDNSASLNPLLARLEQSFQETGGVPECLEVRPLRPLTTSPTWGGLTWSRDFDRFCTHFGCSPTLEPNCPAWYQHEKAAVQTLLRSTTFNTVAELQHTVEARAFATLDVPLLPLPAKPFVATGELLCQVAADGFLRFAGNAYSVPISYATKSVWVQTRGDQIIIRAQDGKLLTNHKANEQKDAVVMRLAHFDLAQRMDFTALRRAFIACFPLDEYFLHCIVAQRKLAAAKTLRAILAHASTCPHNLIRQAFAQCLSYNNFSHRFFQGVLEKPPNDSSDQATVPVEQGQLF